MAYILAIQNGNFSDTATWSGGIIPDAGDIACCGGYRITIDQNTNAILSAAHYDWNTLAGGAALATTHTGGFTLQNNSNFTVAGIRYDTYRTTASPTTNSDFYCLNASLTVTGDITCIATSANANSHSIYITTTDTVPRTFNFNGKIVIPNATSAAHYAVKAVGVANTTNLTLNLDGNVEAMASAAIAVGKALTVTGTFLTLAVTMAGSVVAGGGFTVQPSALSSGASTVTFTNRNLVIGAGVATSSVTITNVKDVLFTNGILFDTAITGNAVNVTSCTNITVNGSIEALLTASAQVTLSSTNSTTVNGDIIRYPSVSTNTSRICSFTGNGSVVVNGILKELANNQAAGSSSYSLISLMTLTANFTCNGIYASGKADCILDLVAGSWNYTVTVNGDVDFSDVSYEGSANTFINFTAFAGSLVITGDVYAAALGTVSSYSVGAITIATTIKTLQVLGTCYGSTKQPALALATAANQPTTECFINKIVGAPYNSSDTYQISSVYSDKAVVTVNELVFGETGRNPISGQFVFKNTTTAVIKARNSLGAEILLMQQTSTTIPIAEDVRSGVAIGSTVGTLILSSYPTARYWRINMSANNGSQYFSLQEVEIFDPAGNLLVSPTTPTNQSTYYEAPEYVANATKLVDGLLQDPEHGVWVSSGVNTQEWVSFDLLAPVEVKSFKLWPQYNAPVSNERAPKDFTIEYSHDQSTWQVAYTAINQSNWVMNQSNSYILPYTNAGGSVDLSEVIQKLNQIKSNTALIPLLSL